MHQSRINSHSSVYWESFYQRKRSCLGRIVSVPIQLHFLCLSVQFPPRGIKGSYSPPFIHPSDCWTDWSQLIWGWQKALLLAHWPTSTKGRSHERNSKSLLGQFLNQGEISTQTCSSSLWHFSLTPARKGWAERVPQIPKPDFFHISEQSCSDPVLICSFKCRSWYRLCIMKNTYTYTHLCKSPEVCAVQSQHQNLIDSSWASQSLCTLFMSARICLSHKNDSTGLSLLHTEYITLPDFITIKGLTCLWYVKWSVGEWTRQSWITLPLFLQIALFKGRSSRAANLCYGVQIIGNTEGQETNLKPSGHPADDWAHAP